MYFLHSTKNNDYLYSDGKIIAEKQDHQWYIVTTTLNSLCPCGIDKTPVADITMHLNDDEVQFLEENGVL